MQTLTDAQLPLLVRDLRVNLGGRPVLKGVSLQVEPASLVGLVGPNGAGKTTLLRTILGVIPRLGGQVTVKGKTGRKAARAIGYVPQRQDFAWDYPISVEGVVMTGFTGRLGLFRRPNKTHWEAVYRALQQVKLWDLRDRTVGELSGGQRQRVLIARALATEPDVLLLDEPFTGLDQPTMDLLLELFRDLADQGAALLMSTHDLAGAMHTCDRLVLLNRTVQADATPKELREPQLWMDTYQVGAKSPLLSIIGAALQHLDGQAGLQVSALHQQECSLLEDHSAGDKPNFWPRTETRLDPQPLLIGENND